MDVVELMRRTVMRSLSKSPHTFGLRLRQLPLFVEAKRPRSSHICQSEKAPTKAVAALVPRCAIAVQKRIMPFASSWWNAVANLSQQS